MDRIGISHISTYVPDTCIDNFSLAESLGEDKAFVTNRIGAHSLPIKGASQETSDLAVGALNRLLKESALDKGEIGCLLLCTQNPDGCGLPHTSAIVQHKADLPVHLPAFDISLGCSGYIYGLKILQGFMRELSLDNGILITADPYSKIIDSADKSTRMLFGDAATATLLSIDSGEYSIGNCLLSTDGKGGKFLKNDEGTLRMNGRQIFNFAATQVPKQILKLLENEGFGKDDIDLYILHQGSKYIVDTIRKRLGLTIEKLPCDIRQTGNTISSSIPLLLKRHVEENVLENILLSGFGVGLSWGSVLLKQSRSTK